MNSNLLKAKEQLINGNFTCVLVKDSTVYTSHDRGVKPLLELIEKGIDLRSFSAADKVVGKATAFLYVLAEVKEVYAPVMSKSAKDILTKHGIKAFCDKSVDFIINRKGDGLCPMETAVKGIQDPQIAMTAVKEKLKAL